MDDARLMSSYSICSFILIAWHLAPGLIYCTLLRHGSKDRIIHLPFNCSVVFFTLSKHIANFNESSQYHGKNRVSWTPLIARDLNITTYPQRLHVFELLCPLPLKERPFSQDGQNNFLPIILFVECCGWKFQKKSAIRGGNSIQKTAVLLTEQ